MGIGNVKVTKTPAGTTSRSSKDLEKSDQPTITTTVVAARSDRGRRAERAASRPAQHLSAADTGFSLTWGSQSTIALAVTSARRTSRGPER